MASPRVHGGTTGVDHTQRSTPCRPATRNARASIARARPSGPGRGPGFGVSPPTTTGTKGDDVELDQRCAEDASTYPADRTEGAERGRFERLAESGSFLASSPLFFGVCLIVLVVWMVGLVAGASNQFETAATGLISAVTLVLVALLKNAELRAERAIQRKLDAIASSLLQDKRGGNGDSEQHLEEAIGVHEQI